jgi:hypothetical protein
VSTDFRLNQRCFFCGSPFAAPRFYSSVTAQVILAHLSNHRTIRRCKVLKPIWIADAHRDDGKRYVVRADEKLTTFVELQLAGGCQVLPDLTDFHGFL